MEDWAQQIAGVFDQDMFDIPSTDDLFNMYRDRVSNGRDVGRAPAIRRRNLLSYLRAYPGRPEALLMIEAPGPWGCRFSGVPITSEAQLLDPAFPITGERTSARAEPMTEYSANIFWRILRFFIWNTVPFHPYHRERPDSIRGPRVAEIKQFVPMNLAVIDILKPRQIFAVGRKAERLLIQELGLECTYVRHPSQGGASLFEAAMLAAFQSTGNSG